MIYVCETAVAAGSDKKNFPSDWLFMWRWGKGKGKGKQAKKAKAATVDEPVFKLVRLRSMQLHCLLGCFPVDG
jgi:hypothetical protein